MTDWQPIETAPRDKIVDLWFEECGRVVDSWWDEIDRCWVVGPANADPVAWMPHPGRPKWLQPLPPPPKTEGG